MLIFTMASIHQVRGMLLEEAVLMLLRAAGNRTITVAGDDPTLGTCAAGMTVLGRGACHQIDAIADLRIGQPFSHPQRLLVEAKSYADHRMVGLPTIRGAVGALKDVSEFWVARGLNRPATVRYHYQAAVFSSSNFTADAQSFAFAQDVYLLPLARSSYFAPVITALNATTANLPQQDSQAIDVTLSELRRHVRQQLQPDLPIETDGAPHFPWLFEFLQATQAVGRSLIATLGHAFPVFLTPRPDLNLDALSTVQQIEIHFRTVQGANGWTISRPGGEVLFTFDLPKQLFDLYADEGVLSRRRAIDLKAAYLGDFTALYAPHDEIKVFNFRLAPDWIDAVRESIGREENA